MSLGDKLFYKFLIISRNEFKPGRSPVALKVSNVSWLHPPFLSRYMLAPIWRFMSDMREPFSILLFAEFWQVMADNSILILSAKCDRSSKSFRTFLTEISNNECFGERVSHFFTFVPNTEKRNVLRSLASNLLNSQTVWSACFSHNPLIVERWLFVLPPIANWRY